MTPPKAYISWSTGKDSAFALLEARRRGLAEIVGVLTTVNEVYDRVSMHGVRRTLLARQIEELGLPSLTVALPNPCSNEIYDERMGSAIARIAAEGVRHIVFGDLFLEDIRAYREQRLASVGMNGIFPLWQRDTMALAREMLTSGFIAHLVTIDPNKLDPGFAGQRLTTDLLASLPASVDPCGENGEFHTFVSAGPMFARPIAVKPGKTVERDGFLFADLLEDQPSALRSRKLPVTPSPPLGELMRNRGVTFRATGNIVDKIDRIHG